MKPWSLRVSAMSWPRDRGAFLNARTEVSPTKTRSSACDWPGPVSSATTSSRVNGLAANSLVSLKRLLHFFARSEAGILLHQTPVTRSRGGQESRIASGSRRVLRRAQAGQDALQACAGLDDHIGRSRGAGEGDVRLLEGLQNREIERAARLVDVARVVDEQVGDEVDRPAGGQGVDIDHRLGLPEDLRHRAGDAQDQPRRLFRIGRVGDGQLQLDAAPRVLFCTCFVMRSEFGTITVVRSKVSMSVARTRMRRILPSTPPTLTQSP